MLQSSPTRNLISARPQRQTNLLLTSIRKEPRYEQLGGYSSSMQINSARQPTGCFFKPDKIYPPNAANTQSLQHRMTISRNLYDEGRQQRSASQERGSKRPQKIAIAGFPQRSNHQRLQSAIIGVSGSQTERSISARPKEGFQQKLSLARSNAGISGTKVNLKPRLDMDFESRTMADTNLDTMDSPAKIFYQTHSQPKFKQSGIGLKDMTNQTESVFGVNGYIIPKDEEARLPIKNLLGKMADSKKPRKTTIDEVIQTKKDVPAPNQYIKQWKWDNATQGVGRPKGKFLQDKRVTMTTMYANMSKEVPASNKYKTTRKTKILGTYNNKDQRIGFTDEEVYRSKELPAFTKYKAPHIEIIRERSQKCIINSKEKNIGIRSQRLKKDNKPSMCSYDTQKAFQKTQYFSIASTTPQSQRVSFIDTITKSKAFVPPPGSYFKKPKE